MPSPRKAGEERDHLKSAQFELLFLLFFSPEKISGVVNVSLHGVHTPHGVQRHHGVFAVGGQQRLPVVAVVHSKVFLEKSNENTFKLFVMNHLGQTSRN